MNDKLRTGHLTTVEDSTQQAAFLQQHPAGKRSQLLSMNISIFRLHPAISQFTHQVYLDLITMLQSSRPYDVM